MSRSTRLASAGIVAAAVLAIAACGTSTSSGGVAGATGTPSTSLTPASIAPASTEPSMAASPTSSGAALNQVFIQFEAQNGSNITGGGILTDLGDNQTAVTIGVVAAGVTDPMPAQIVPGDCTAAASASPPPAASAAPSGSAAPAAASPEASGAVTPLDPTTNLKLGDLAAGSSNTVLALTLDSLLSQPHAIVIYKSAADPTVVACADITR
ncbi:MAG TPA: hypothetical protein VFV72_02170 [Candidatus Limnocylindrales bacterium]|nr:hypothetical protein [Candidatus Limnocylindrales bacterium]